MWIEGHNREWKADDPDELADVLAFRDPLGGAQFWLSHTGLPHPLVAIRISGDLCDVHYFPSEGHPGFRALATPPAMNNQSVTFTYEGCDPASGEDVPARFVLSFASVVAIAREFHRSQALPGSAPWLEL
jgi:hypothetical protein